MLQDHPKFAFVIDTTENAGAFGRELCAFMTGQIGDCGVGDEEASEFLDMFPDRSFEELVEQVKGKNGFYQPVQIWPDSDQAIDGDVLYRSVAIFLRTPPTVEQTQFLMDRAKTYCAREKIPLISFRLIQIRLVCTELPFPVS